MTQRILFLVIAIASSMILYAQDVNTRKDNLKEYELKIKEQEQCPTAGYKNLSIKNNEIVDLEVLPKTVPYPQKKLNVKKCLKVYKKYAILAARQECYIKIYNECQSIAANSKKNKDTFKILKKCQKNHEEVYRCILKANGEKYSNCDEKFDVDYVKYEKYLLVDSELRLLFTCQGFEFYKW